MGEIETFEVGGCRSLKLFIIRQRPILFCQRHLDKEASFKG